MGTFLYPLSTPLFPLSSHHVLLKNLVYFFTQKKKIFFEGTKSITKKPQKNGTLKSSTKAFNLISYIFIVKCHLSTLQHLYYSTSEHVSGAERWEFPLPAHVGVRSPRSTAQSRSRPLRSIPFPAHLQFHPTPVKSLHAHSNLKFLCIPNTCRFQPKP